MALRRRSEVMYHGLANRPAHRGALQWKIRSTGREAHSSDAAARSAASGSAGLVPYRATLALRRRSEVTGYRLANKPFALAAVRGEVPSDGSPGAV